MWKQIFGAGLLCVCLVGCAQGGDSAVVMATTNDPGQEADYEALLESSPVAGVEGELRSPDGRSEVRTSGKTDTYVSGLVVPERLEIVEAETEDVLWSDMGYLTQSALWSPDGQYLALAYGGRTWNSIRVFETDTWAFWDFTLPDGSSIPEYTFLPEDWGRWCPEGNLIPSGLEVTVGRGGDGEEQHTYYCMLYANNDGDFLASVWETQAEELSEAWDFDGDSSPERVVIVNSVPDSAIGVTQIRLCAENGRILRVEDAGSSHAGWNSLFACEWDGKDYLLRYLPTMYQGYCTYSFQVFSLDENGGEVLLDEDAVEFDTNIGGPVYDGNFDPAAIAAFVEHLNRYLEHSKLLLTTDDALADIDPEHPVETLGWLTGDPLYAYDENLSLEENLHGYEVAYLEARTN